MSEYRPTGPLHWFLPRVTVKRWDFLGCLGTEDRSITAWHEFRSHSAVRSTSLLQIEDAPSRYADQVKERLSRQRLEFLSAGGQPEEISRIDLLARTADIVNVIDAFIEKSKGNVCIDITSLPKRFFFPAVKRILNYKAGTGVKNLIVTYTAPESYANDALAEQVDEWDYLPLFGGTSLERADVLVIGVGFHPLGLQEELNGEWDKQIVLVIPFPAPLAAYRRSWEMVRHLQQFRSPEAFETFRAGSRDASDMFDRLLRLSDDGVRRLDLAPFGPKPMSLAMCLFAAATDSSVFYTQPSFYHPDYTSGVSRTDGAADVTCFGVRLASHDYYRV